VNRDSERLQNTVHHWPKHEY